MNPSESLRETAAKFNMLSPGDSVVVGVSGGADSTALLLLLWENRDRLQIRSLRVCHLHHGIRGEEAERDLAFVRELAGSLNLPFAEKRVDIPSLAAREGLSCEETGRRERYAFFEETADALALELDCPRERVKIATAHTAGDNAETLLLNLIRGCGLSGLCGIPPVRGRIIRPLLETARPELEEYLREKNISWMEDSTNSGDGYRRNRIRHNILPLLKEENPSLLTGFSRMSAILREEDEYLRSLTGETVRSARLSQHPLCYDRNRLNLAEDPILRRAAVFLLQQAGFEPDNEKAEALFRGIRSGSGGITLAPGLCWRITPGRVLLEREIPPMEPVVFQPGEKYVRGCWELYGENSAENPLHLKFVHENCFKNTLDCGKIKGNLILRSRQTGDSILPVGRGCRKTLKKLFSEGGVPERDSVPVLADDLGPVWVAGFGIDQRVCCDSGSVCFLTVRSVRTGK